MVVCRSRVASHSHRVLLLVVVKHVGQDIFRVLETLGHFGIVAVKSLVQRHRRSLTLLVHVCHISVLRVQKDLRVILEVNLHNFVAESKHYSVLGSHPFFDVDATWWVLKLVGLVEKVSLNQLLLLLRIIILLKVRFEMLEKGHFLLQLLGEI